jgi:hypothetical protein
MDESDDGYSMEDKFRQLEEEVAILVAGKRICYAYDLATTQRTYVI